MYLPARMISVLASCVNANLSATSGFKQSFSSCTAKKIGKKHFRSITSSLTFFHSLSHMYQVLSHTFNKHRIFLDVQSWTVDWGYLRCLHSVLQRSCSIIDVLITYLPQVNTTHCSKVKMSLTLLQYRIAVVGAETAFRALQPQRS